MKRVPQVFYTEDSHSYQRKPSISYHSFLLLFFLTGWWTKTVSFLISGQTYFHANACKLFTP